MGTKEWHAARVVEGPTGLKARERPHAWAKCAPHADTKMVDLRRSCPSCPKRIYLASRLSSELSWICVGAAPLRWLPTSCTTASTSRVFGYQGVATNPVMNDLRRHESRLSVQLGEAENLRQLAEERVLGTYWLSLF